MKIQCPICGNEPDRFFRKQEVLYSQCGNCKTVFCDPLEQEGMIGGEYEVERNEKENHLRISRVNELVVGIPKEEVRILDFGAGHGLLVEDLKNAGYAHVDGYDAYYEKYQKLPSKESYHVIVCVECLEHMSHPFIELDLMYRSLVDHGAVILESGYVDVAKQDGVDIEDYFYIAPQSGHSTIFSHHGIDVLMSLKGFIPRQHFNRHVRTYQKIVKK